jgi:hypothetical protein
MPAMLHTSILISDIFITTPETFIKSRGATTNNPIQDS